MTTATAKTPANIVKYLRPHKYRWQTVCSVSEKINGICINTHSNIKNSCALIEIENKTNYDLVFSIFENKQESNGVGDISSLRHCQTKH